MFILNGTNLLTYSRPTIIMKSLNIVLISHNFFLRSKRVVASGENKIGYYCGLIE